MLSEQEIEERRETAQYALASQRLEGLEPDAELVAEVERYVIGEIELHDIINRYTEKVRREPRGR